MAYAIKELSDMNKMEVGAEMNNARQDKPDGEAETNAGND